MAKKTDAMTTSGPLSEDQIRDRFIELVRKTNKDNPRPADVEELRKRYCQLKHSLTKMVAITGTRNVPDLNIVYPKMAKFV
jgi:hypothetical protein